MAEGRTLCPGIAEGAALVLTAPLSLWGGMDPATGELTDVHHPQRGASLSRRVLVLPSGRGSSSSSSVLAEAIRTATAPAAIILETADPILALGAIVAAELYDLRCPVVVADVDLRDGDRVRVVAPPAGAATIDRL